MPKSRVTMKKAFAKMKDILMRSNTSNVVVILDFSTETREICRPFIIKTLLSHQFDRKQ